MAPESNATVNRLNLNGTLLLHFLKPFPSLTFWFFSLFSFFFFFPFFKAFNYFCLPFLLMYRYKNNFMTTTLDGFCVMSKNSYTSHSLVFWLNRSRLEADLAAVQCSQDPLLQAGIAGQQLEVWLECANPWCDDLSQRIYKPADGALPHVLCSSEHSVRASAHGWLHLHVDHEGLSSAHVPSHPPATLGQLGSWKTRKKRLMVTTRKQNQLAYPNKTTKQFFGGKNQKTFGTNTQ